MPRFEPLVIAGCALALAAGWLFQRLLNPAVDFTSQELTGFTSRWIVPEELRDRPAPRRIW